MSEEKKISEELEDSELDEVVGGRKAIYYYVQKNDLLSDIAKKYSVTVAQLCEWNNISNPNLITIGQKLRVG